jgi:2-polyprenyl-3-methyl-5-hydroxy-6-metoxy-1,4-benzoquinol methylase
MKLTAFKYTDAKGNITTRQILNIGEPTDKVTGIDLSELNTEESAQYAAKYGMLLDTFKTSALALAEEFDIVHNFRQFIPARMEDVVSEYV